jgi:hypothetical protein
LTGFAAFKSETRIGWVKEIGGLRKVKLRGLARGK